MAKISTKHLLSRGEAARSAVRAGVDPHIALSYVVWPTPQFLAASRGHLPRGWRLLSEEELLERRRDAKRQVYRGEKLRYRLGQGKAA